jgi:hypothetical protein
VARIVWDSSIHRLLRERYPAQAWAIFFEVASGIGRYSGRYADAIAMSIFPSRGLDFHGFEIKVDRRDWLRELKDPAKADEIGKYCDYWWLVLGKADVAKDEEIPRTWGVLIHDGNRLVQKKAASRLKAKSIDRPFVAALLRRAHEMAAHEKRKVDDKFAMEKAVQDSYQRGVRDGREHNDSDLQIAVREREALQSNLNEFQKKSGIEINKWNGGRIGEAVESLRWLKKNTSTEALDSAANSLERAAQDLREKSKALSEAPDNIPSRMKPLEEPLVDGKLSQ